MTSGIGFSPGVLVSEPASPFPPSPSLPAYRWVWPDATARLAQAVTAAQIGGIGYQVDIRREYQLMALTGGAPNEWGERVDPSLGQMNSITPTVGTGITAMGTVPVTAFGTLVGILQTTTTRATTLIRCLCSTTAVPGAIAVYRAGGSTSPIPRWGYRYTAKTVLNDLTLASRWYMGITGSPPLANVAPNSIIFSVGIGADAAQTTTRLMHCGLTAPATEIDLGAAFPAKAAGTGLELQVFTLDGASYAWQVRNLATAAEVSGTFNAAMPDPFISAGWLWYASNNTDAAIVSAVIGGMQWPQVTR